MAQQVNFLDIFSELAFGMTSLAMMGGSSPFSLVFFGVNLVV